MKILILGDIHGELDRCAAIVRRAKSDLGIRAAIQVGDFGFESAIIQAWLDSSNAPFAVPVHAIDGNHEDHPWLQEIHRTNADQAWRSSNLVFHARGSTARIGGRTIGFCGGALHADRPQEGTEEVLLGREPAAPNWLTPTQADQAVAAFTKHPPEVMITHSCPCGIGIGIRGSEGFAEQVTACADELGLGAIPVDDCGEPSLARVWHGLASKPRHWLFGHFHTIHQRCRGSTTFTCTGTGDRDVVRPITLDTQTMQLTIGSEWDMVGYA